MALTVNQSPVDITPAFNPQIFEVTSTNVANSGFLYVVVAEDTLTSQSQTYRIKQAPSTPFELKWDGYNFSRKFVKHYVTNTAGWQVCADGLRKIEVEFKEYYGSTLYPMSPPEITNYYVWNGVERTLDWVDYDVNDYLYKDGLSANHVTLNQLSRQKTYADSSLYLYFLATPDFANFSGINGIEVKTYDSNGTLLGTSTIANSYATSVNYYERYNCIDIGHKGLTNILAGDVVGTYPIITDQVAYYEIRDNGGLTADLYLTVDIECEPTFDVFTLHYVGKTGAFETIHMSKNSIHTERAEKTYYRQNPYTLTSNTWSYTKFDAHQKVSSSTGTESYTLNSDWLTESEINVHRQLITSPLVYWDMGASIGLIPVRINTETATINKSYNQKLYGMTIDMEITAKNNYQHG